MKRSALLFTDLLERIVGEPELENIVVGTGVLAKDMQNKLRLLGLSAPLLIGDKSDVENNIRHYSEINTLGDPKRYRFIICCDLDEWTLIAPAISAAYKFLGNASWNHPKVLRFTANTTLYEKAGKQVTDAENCNIILRKGRPYEVFGDENDDDSFHIHILGNSHGGGIYRFTSKSYPEMLYDKLNRSGFNATVYTWVGPIRPVSDGIMSLIRDVCFHKSDLVILYSGIAELRPLYIATKNALSTRAGAATSMHQFIWQLHYTYNREISNGIDHEIDLFSLMKVQQRIFTALSKLYDFTFWDIIAPIPNILPENQARKLRNLSPGYLSRQRQKKDELLAILDKQYVKDYTDTFIGVDDIYSMFADDTHLSDSGNRMVAERCAADILKAFGRNKMEGTNGKAD